MGLIGGLLMLPLAPVRGTVWIAGRLAEQAERELDDPARLEQLLVDAEAAHEAGLIDEEELERIEEDVVLRLVERGGA